MYFVGRIGGKAEPLGEITYEALMRGIAAVKPGATPAISAHAIVALVDPQRLLVVRDFCGHGLGRMFHEPPNVIHFGRPGQGVLLKPGMFFTIEPMMNPGKPLVTNPVRRLDRGDQRLCAVSPIRALRSA